MLRTRVMPCLLLQGRKLVKTKKFTQPRYVGDPINAVRIFNQKEVDELILLDINATVHNQKIQFELIEQISSECFMPLSYGGGVRSLEDFRTLFSIGIEKISVSSLLFNNPELVQKVVSIYGSQSIVATLDVKKSWWGNYNVYINSAKIKTNYSILAAVRQACLLDVGEIIINSIDRDGTWSGFDLNLLSSVVNEVDVPVVAMGGAGQLMHIKEAVLKAQVSGVAIGSMAVFQAQEMGVLIKFPKMQELELLLS